MERSEIARVLDDGDLEKRSQIVAWVIEREPERQSGPSPVGEAPAAAKRASIRRALGPSAEGF